jgi:hypothetical protein
VGNALEPYGAPTFGPQVTRNWRLTFGIEDNELIKVNYEDITEENRMRIRSVNGSSDPTWIRCRASRCTCMGFGGR